MTLNDAQIERYARHIILPDVGGTGQAQLLASKVLVVGAGGLGSPLLMYLAAAGVGTLGLVDDDRVALSNLQRQIAHGTPALDEKKVESARRTIAALNPEVRVECHPVRLDADNVRALSGGYDIVADGSDNFETRFLLNDSCYDAKKTLVSAAVLRFVMGYLSDIWSRQKTVAVGMAFGAGSVVFLLMTDGSLWQLVIFVVLIAFAESVSAVSWALIGDFFGRKSFATLRGGVTTVHSFLSMGTPVFAGFIFDRYDSYFWALVPITGLYVAAAIAFWVLPKPKIPQRLLESSAEAVPADDD